MSAPVVMPPTPEIDKMRAIQTQSQAIGEFLEWHAAHGLVLCRYRDDLDMDEVGWHPAYESIERHLAAFFEIDLAKVDAEKRAILDAVRAQS